VTPAILRSQIPDISRHPGTYFRSDGVFRGDRGGGARPGRTDALTSRPECEPGVLQTVPLAYIGDHLLVDADLFDARDLSCRLLDAEGAVIPGFEDENAVVTRSYDSWYEIHWFEEKLRGKTWIMNNATPPAALCLTLRRGSLYAFRIVDTIPLTREIPLPEEPPVALSHHPQLFLDDGIIARTVNLRRRLEQPQKHPANPLFTNDHPWDKRYMQTSSVVYDGDNDRWQAWYWCNGGPGSEYSKPGDGYAESDDGISWTKPMVGKDSNLVEPAKLARSVFLDPDDPDAGRRYKGSFAACSADGIVWRADEEESQNWLAAVGKNDTLTSFVRWKGEYLNYTRYQGPETNTIVYDPRTEKTWKNAVFRCTGLSTSTDFRHWTAKEQIFATDARDGYPWTQAHALCVTAYGDVLIGLLPLMHLFPEDDNNFLATQDTQLMVSRDGRRWDRVADRAVFIPCEEVKPIGERPWDAHVHPVCNFVVKDDRVWIYYWGTNFLHGENRPNDSGIGALSSPKQRLATAPFQYGLGLATLPADRFVALHPVSYTAEGMLETKMFTHGGGDLRINADLGAQGTVQVEVLDVTGEVLPGFDRKSCRLSPRDPLRYDVSWKQEDGGVKTFGNTAQGHPVALRLIVINCSLYAFQVS